MTLPLLPEVEEFGPFQVHELPAGGRIFYRDAPGDSTYYAHSYWRDVKRKGADYGGTGRLLGVSTVAKTFDTDSGDGLLWWAVKLAYAGIAEVASLGLGCEDADDILSSLDWLRDAGTIATAMDDAEATWFDIRKRAGTRGTNVHEKALQALGEGHPVPLWDEMTEEEKGYAQGVVAWWMDANPRPIHTELVVADLELGVAGRLDLIAEVDGVTTLFDAKTSKYVGAPAAVQQAGYRHLCAASGYVRPREMRLLQLGADGTHRVIPVEATEEDFLAAVQVHRRSKEIGAEMRKAMKDA